MFGLDKTWALDERLHNDTLPVCEDENRVVLLMNDKRWPWVIIVPKIPDAEELTDLDFGDSGRLEAEFQYVSHIGSKLKEFTDCEKINTAMIGNIVRQLHIHVIARSENDANWPKPVWGFGQAEKYSNAEGQALAEQLKEEFSAPFIS